MGPINGNCLYFHICSLGYEFRSIESIVCTKFFDLRNQSLLINFQKTSEIRFGVPCGPWLDHADLSNSLPSIPIFVIVTASLKFCLKLQHGGHWDV